MELKNMKITFCHPHSSHKTVYLYHKSIKLSPFFLGLSVSDERLPYISFGNQGDYRKKIKLPGLSWNGYLSLKTKVPKLAEAIWKFQPKVIRLIDTRWKSWKGLS